MYTISFEGSRKKPLYQQLYSYVRQSIERGDTVANQKLPSKRRLAAHLNISQFTVQSAYSQLQAEGYIRSVEKKGYYACEIEPIRTPQGHGYGYGGRFICTRSRTGTDEPSPVPTASPVPVAPNSAATYDLKTNTLDTRHFPYSVWSRLMRQCMRDQPNSLVSPIDAQGDPGLRTEIAHFLHDYRNMEVSPEQIVLGAGTEYLLGLISELLPEETFAIENPGYHKFSKLLNSRHIPFCPIDLAGDGIDIEQLRNNEVSVALITPSHQFPLGFIMGIAQRQQLLAWANTAANKYLIEDDFNSEFHFVRRPIPSLYSLDTNGKVIYLNSFANTLAPSMRIAYMVLPSALLSKFQESLRFYSCTVSAFEQLTLRMFLQEGYFERHLNRMRTVYRKRQEALIGGLSALQDRLTISGQQAGLHLLLTMPDLLEQELVDSAAQNGVAVYPLSDYFYSRHTEMHTVVVGFAGYQTDQLQQAAQRLVEAWG